MSFKHVKLEDFTQNLDLQLFLTTYKIWQHWTCIPAEYL